MKWPRAQPCLADRGGKHRWRYAPDRSSRTCQKCATVQHPKDQPKPQYLEHSRFEPRALPEAIWVGDECITGPFCVHCGWPLSLHGPEGRCRRYGHPLLPQGDLPVAADN